MKFYKAGKLVRDIDDMTIGQTYAVCGIVGALVIKPDEHQNLPYQFANLNEGINLSIKRESLIDRIRLGMVSEIKKEFRPREKTIAKLYSGIKK